MAETKGARKSREYRERHPERVRVANLARNDYKREWESGECPQCGGPFASAKKSSSAICRPCRNEEIERLEGLPLNTVATHLHRAKKHYGMDIPRSPYFKAPA